MANVDLSLFEVSFTDELVNIRDVDTDYIITVLELIFKRTTFLGLKEVIEMGYASNYTEMYDRLDVLLKISTFNDLFFDFLALLQTIKFRGSIRKLPYELVVFGKFRSLYFLSGLSRQVKDRYVIFNGTKVLNPAEFFIRDYFKDYNDYVQDGYVLKQYDNISITKFVHIVFGCPTSDGNLGVIKSNIFSVNNHIKELNELRKKYNIDINTSGIRKTVIYDESKSKCRYGKFFISTETKQSGRSNRLVHINTLHKYYSMLNDYEDLIGRKEISKKSIETLRGYILMALGELSFYNDEDAVVATTVFRNKIKHGMQDLRIRMKSKGIILNE